ncbi:MAG: tetratricopeptide repeat protein [Deltaproteobacteria bacterium]|nr:tetratricopeptide repeat protein [Deltaproteobacteria bacterium]
MSEERTGHNTVESISADDLKQVLGPLLDAKERNRIIETFLKDELELPGYQAKFVAKILVPSLEKLIGATVSRHFINIHDALRRRFDGYDRRAFGIGRWLGYRLAPSMAKGAILKQLTSTPKGIAEDAWKKLNDQSRICIKQLAELKQIGLALGDLTATVTLDIDKPGNLKDLQPSRWLRPYNDFIPMKGRAPYLKYLTAFCSADSVFLWTLLTGDGGIGKTRLAHEFAKMQETEGWHAGFLRQDGLEQLVDHPGFRNWRPLTETFMMVDYAANKIEALKKMLVRCVRIAREEETDNEPVRLRLLLLERHGSPEDGWLEQLMICGEGAQHDDIVSSLKPPRKVEAPAVESVDATMEDILHLTLGSWGRVTGRQPPALPVFDESGWAHFRDATQMRPLFVEMAGIHACETGDALGLVRWTQNDLLKAAVAREREYIQKNCPAGVPAECLYRAVALLTFTGPQSLKAGGWMKLLAKDANASGFPAVQPGALCNASSDLLGVEADGITPLGPDILAAAFSVSVLRESPSGVADLLKNMLDLAGIEAWSRLLRAAIDLYNFEDLTIIGEWLLVQIDRRPLEELYAVENLVQKISVAHRRLLVKLYETMIEKISKKPSPASEQARILSNLGPGYGALGRREEALAAARRAVEIYEDLAKRNPDAFEHHLARSLNNVAISYRALGRIEEALATTKRAEVIWGRLAERDPDAFEHYLAMSLHNMGIWYGDLGCHDDGLAAEERAVQIRARLAKRNPEAFEPYLATSLNSVGNRYSALGRDEEALKATERAVGIYERLAKRNPDAFEPDLAASLNNLGSSYSDLARPGEALAAVERAVSTYERLVKRNPDAFEPYLASILGTKGTVLRAVGRNFEAADSFLKGIGSLKRLFLRTPVPFFQTMRSLLNDYVNARRSIGIEPETQFLEAILAELNRKPRE